MGDRGSPSQGDANHPNNSCMRFVLPLFIIVLVVTGLFRINAGRTDIGILLIIVGLSLLFIFPAGYLARRVFRGRFGDFIRGDTVDHPIIRTKRLSLSIREERRPWWILWPILFILGWVLVFVIMNYVN
jgi:hypothetical protein